MRRNWPVGAIVYDDINTGKVLGRTREQLHQRFTIGHPRG